MTKKAFLSALLMPIIVFGGLPLVESLQFITAAKTTCAAASTATVTELWNFTSGSEMVLSLVVADGFVYIKSGPSGSPYSILYCINASTGVQVWNKTGSFYRFAVANGYVYVGQGSPGAVSCLSASNGAQLWNYSCGTLVGTPVIERGVVYVATADGFVYAFDAMKGRKIWSFSGPVGTDFYPDPLVLADANLYALSAAYSEEDASWHSGIYAFNAHTGGELWSYTTPGKFGSLTAAGQTVYVSSNFVNTTNYLDAKNSGGYVYDSGVLALNASDGTRIWDYPTSSSIHSPILANDTIYAVYGDGEFHFPAVSGDVYALAASDGKPIWNYSIGLETSPPLLVNGYLYVGSSAGVYCFNASTGTVNWNFKATEFAGSWGVTIPAYTNNGVIYVGLNGNPRAPITYYFYALDALSGDRIWNYTIDGTVRCSPVIVGTTVYIGATYPTEEYPYRGLGTVFALNSTITSLPHSTSFPFLTTLVVASVISVAVVSIGLLIYFKKRKR